MTQQHGVTSEDPQAKFDRITEGFCQWAQGILAGAPQGATTECSLCRGAGFVTYRDGIAYETHDVEKEEHMIEDCPECQPTRDHSENTSRRCQKCGVLTNSEEALIGTEIWCHPCADELSSSHSEKS